MVLQKCFLFELAQKSLRSLMLFEVRQDKQICFNLAFPKSNFNTPPKQFQPTKCSIRKAALRGAGSRPSKDH